MTIRNTLTLIKSDRILNQNGHSMKIVLLKYNLRTWGLCSYAKQGLYVLFGRKILFIIKNHQWWRIG